MALSISFFNKTFYLCRILTQFGNLSSTVSNLQYRDHGFWEFMLVDLETEKTYVEFEVAENSNNVNRIIRLTESTIERLNSINSVNRRAIKVEKNVNSIGFDHYSINFD